LLSGVVAGLDAAGVRAVPFGPGVRFVTHRDVDDDDITRVLDRVAGIAAP